MGAALTVPGRVPAGVPGGGQFAASTHTEPDVALAAHDDSGSRGADRPWERDLAVSISLGVTVWASDEQYAQRLADVLLRGDGIITETHPDVVETVARIGDNAIAEASADGDLTPDERGRVAYDAVIATVRDARAGLPVGPPPATVRTSPSLPPAHRRPPSPADIELEDLERQAWHAGERLTELYETIEDCEGQLNHTSEPRTVASLRTAITRARKAVPFALEEEKAANDAVEMFHARQASAGAHRSPSSPQT